VAECGPGRVLAGLVRRIDPQLVTANIFDPASLADAKGQLA
jgi:[acyl-carrier-protein] S-malonyltransferase